MLNTFTLKNGIRVATYDIPSLKSVHLRITAKCGSVVETVKDNGVAHFMEHMLVAGIPSLPNVEQFSGYIEGLAGTFNAHTEELAVGFSMTVPLTHLNDAVKISSEVFFEPIFPEDAIEKERRVVLSEIEQRMDSHFYKISQFFREKRFRKNHPLILNSGGSLKVIQKLKKADLINYWQKYFLSKNTYLIITGNFPTAKLKQMLDKYFLRFNLLKKFPGYPTMKNEDFSKRCVAIRDDKSLQTVYFDLTFPSLNLRDKIELRVKQGALLNVLGRLRNSRLFKLLRYQKGLVYDVNCGSTTFPELGYIYIVSQIAPQHLDEVIKLISQELSNFFHNGPTDEELEFAKNFLINQWLMAFDHPSAIAGWIEGDLLWQDKVGLPDDYIKMIENVTAGELVDLMQKYWDFDKLNLTLQGPIVNSEQNVKKFESMLEGLKK